MNKILTSLALCFVATACAPSGENDDTGSSENAVESNQDKQVTKHGGPSCGGWACSSASRPVSDDEIFDLIARTSGTGADGDSSTDPGVPTDDEGSSGTPAQPSKVVRLSAIECVDITDACTRSCAIRTPCGGGGHVAEADSTLLANWIRRHGAIETDVRWATRATVGNVTCSRLSRPGAKAKCTVAPGGADPNRP